MFKRVFNRLFQASQKLTSFGFVKVPFDTWKSMMANENNAKEVISRFNEKSEDMVDESHAVDMVFGDPFFETKPAMAALQDVMEPNPEHIRACLMEIARHIRKSEKSET
jgi:hypothetical protein